jgi:hypothetical protein
MALTQIILKTGSGDPGVVLANAEPAFDATNEILYIGTGVGNVAVPFYPYQFGFTFDTIDGGIDWITSYTDYLYGGFDWTTPIADKVVGGNW